MGRLRNGVGVGISNIPTLSSRRAFSPLSLFADGSQGVWYDDSLTSSMFQNSDGTTAAVLESPVGLQLDLSRNLTLGSNIVTPAANSTFTSDTGFWTKDTGVTISGGSANWTATAATYQLYKTGQLTVGKYYEATFTIFSITSGGLRCNIGGNLGTVRTTAGTYTERLVAGSGTMAITSSGASTTASVTLVSFFEVTGTHRSQATSANRPTLSARYNLLTKTEQFDNAAWTKVGLTVDATLYTAPNGTLTANKIYATIVSTNHYLYQSFSLTSGVSYAATINGKIGEYRYLYLQTYNGSAFAASIVDLQTGLVTQTGSGHTITSVAVDNGFYYVKIVFTAAATGTGYFYAGPSDVSTAPTAYSWIGDPAKGIYIWGADFRPTNQTVTLPTYQRVDTSSVYDTVGFPQYIKYNGSNSSLSTAGINFTATAQVTAFAGARLLTNTGEGMLLEFGNLSATNGSFTLGNSYLSRYYFGVKNVGVAQIYALTYTAPITNTLSAVYDLTATTIPTQVIPKTNGTTPASLTNSGLPTSLGNFGNLNLYCGARAGTSLFFNGYEFQTIIVGKTLTATEIANTETYVNSKTLAY